MNKTYTRLLPVLVLAAATVHAVVAPNPSGRLAGKRILVINGTESSGDHRNARVALNNKLNQLQALTGFVRDSATGSAPPTNLDNYDIIFFNYWFDNQSSSPAFQNAFKAWVNSTNKPRGWLGIHTSGANELNEWNWLRDSVTSMQYVVHSSSAQLGTVRKTPDTTILAHPIMAAMADTFRAVDEWYEFGYAPTWGDARVMYYLDESTLSNPLAHPMNPHPMAWFRESPVTGNRFFYTPMIHNSAGVNSTAGNDFFASMILRALEYLAGYQPTSIKLNGQGMYHNKEHVKGVRFIRDGSLTIDAEGAYRVEVRSLQGRLLYRGSGKGSGVHNPGALRKAGMYVVRVAVKSGSYTQRVMVQ